MSAGRQMLQGYCALFVVILWLGAGIARAEENQKPEVQTVPANAPQSQTAIARALEFMQTDAVTWRKEHACATCHHGTFTIWTLSEAKSRGYSVDGETLKEMTAWTKERLDKIDLPRDARPGWSMVSTPALYLSMMARAVPKQEAVTADELKRIAGHLVRHQEADGSWSWASAPAKNRPPPVFESDEVATLLALSALGSQLPHETVLKSEIRDSWKKGAQWLAKMKPSETTQALALRIFVKLQSPEMVKTLQPDIDAFLALQNKDGGWGQLREVPSDAYATGQALYVLSLAGVKNDLPAIQRGVTFLVATQKPDGSWPMIRRGHPGVTPGSFVIPINYFGSAWATLGLLRSVPGEKPSAP